MIHADIWPIFLPDISVVIIFNLLLRRQPRVDRELFRQFRQCRGSGLVEVIVLAQPVVSLYVIVRNTIATFKVCISCSVGRQVGQTVDSPPPPPASSDVGQAAGAAGHLGFTVPPPQYGGLGLGVLRARVLA